jgi:UV DNA damage endonuclease
MIELGYAVRSLAEPDTGRTPLHISRWLAGLADTIRSCVRRGIAFYRMALPATLTYGALEEHAAQLALLRELIGSTGLRLGIHLAPAVGLAVRDEAAAARFAGEVETAAALLARLDDGIRHTLVSHVGAADGAAGLLRFAARYRSLSLQARRRLTVEHDGRGYRISDLLRLNGMCGVPLVFDSLHYDLHNPEGWSRALALGAALASWPGGLRPEVHLSSQRSEAHLLPDGRVIAPRRGQHADFVRLDDALRLLAAARGTMPFDLMIEAKAGDLALIRLRAELQQYRPGWSAVGQTTGGTQQQEGVRDTETSSGRT